MNCRRLVIASHSLQNRLRAEGTIPHQVTAVWGRRRRPRLASGLPQTAGIGRRGWQVSSVPSADAPSAGSRTSRRRRHSNSLIDNNYAKFILAS
jgi:hypothetical protein